MTAARVDVRRMAPTDATAVAALADRLIGDGYYPAETILADLERSRVGDRALCYVAESNDRLVGFRITFPPGQWSSGRGTGLTPAAWPAPLDRAGYFQSCFVDRSMTGHGIGRRLSSMALADLAECGAELVVGHVWKESPHNSSLRYVTRLGFRPVAEHPRYWAEVDYLCSGCRQRPCLCTAIEVIRPLDRDEINPLRRAARG